MKILLSQDVENLGYIGEVVDVKDGYARNYLLPYGLALVPTEANIKSLEEAKIAAAEKRKLKREGLEKLAERLEGAEAVLTAKANEQGHLFGSITEKHIAENLVAQGFEVTDKMVRLDEHLREIGTHEVTLRIDKDLEQKINVIVVSEDQAAEAVEGENKQQPEGVQSEESSQQITQEEPVEQVTDEQSKTQ